MQIADPSLNALRTRIRHGESPDDPSLFTRWWQREEQAVAAAPSFRSRRRLLESQFHLLLDAVMDEVVPRRWRCQCLDHINRPLHALNRLVDSPDAEHKLRRLRWELAVSSRYIQNSL